MQLINEVYQRYTIPVNDFERGGVFMEKFGEIRLHVAELIKERGISKNKLSQRAEMQRTQLNNYCNNKITRLDVDVLARLCTVLECGIGDILEFVPPEEK